MRNLLLSFLSRLFLTGRGWKLENHVPPEIKRYVLIAVPHTSNWDFFYAILFFHEIGLPVKFTIKKEWLRRPFRGMMTSLGAIGIDRGSAKTGRISYVDAMAKLFEENPELIVCITPEGTRKKVEEWKTGFYFVAEKAGVPIAVGNLDYKNRIGKIGILVYPSGDMDKDMRRIMDEYREVYPYNPGGFSVDRRYS